MAFNSTCPGRLHNTSLCSDSGCVVAVLLQVDTTWRDLMEAAHATPSVLALAKDPERLARLEEANKLLEEIQKVRIHAASGLELCSACTIICLLCSAGN
jgi:hypothetical protein